MSEFAFRYQIHVNIAAPELQSTILEFHYNAPNTCYSQQKLSKYTLPLRHNNLEIHHFQIIQPLKQTHLSVNLRIYPTQVIIR